MYVLFLDGKTVVLKVEEDIKPAPILLQQCPGREINMNWGSFHPMKGLQEVTDEVFWPVWVQFIARPMYSNPPLHGAMLVKEILGDDALKQQCALIPAEPLSGDARPLLVARCPAWNTASLLFHISAPKLVPQHALPICTSSQCKPAAARCTCSCCLSAACSCPTLLCARQIAEIFSQCCCSPSRAVISSEVGQSHPLQAVVTQLAWLAPQLKACGPFGDLLQVVQGGEGHGGPHHHHARRAAREPGEPG